MSMTCLRAAANSNTGWRPLCLRSVGFTQYHVDLGGWSSHKCSSVVLVRLQDNKAVIIAHRHRAPGDVLRS
eukprot:4934278-Prymnesium_polylepis.1